MQETKNESVYAVAYVIVELMTELVARLLVNGITVSYQAYVQQRKYKVEPTCNKEAVMLCPSVVSFPGINRCGIALATPNAWAQSAGEYQPAQPAEKQLLHDDRDLENEN